jgi:cytochrome c-type biogenesis protein CcmF
MLVHIGVILIAVALASSNSYTHSATLTIGRGERVEWLGHSFEFVGVSTEVTARADVVMADVLLDDMKVYAPAVTTYLQQGMTVPTPSVRTGWTSDVYLTIDGNDPPATDADEVVLRVFVKPMVLWLWIGGAVMAIGTVLSALPSRRSRRPTDPTSALITSGQHV